MKYLIFLIATLICTSCGIKREYVEIPVEVVKKEYITTTKVDSIFVKDSVDRYVSGDTVYLYKERIKYQYLYKTDTLIQIDSIPKIIKQITTEEVEVNKIYWWQKFLMWLGAIMLLVGTVYVTKLVYLKKR